MLLGVLAPFTGEVDATLQREACPRQCGLGLGRTLPSSLPVAQVCRPEGVGFGVAHAGAGGTWDTSPRPLGRRMRANSVTARSRSTNISTSLHHTRSAVASETGMFSADPSVKFTDPSTPSEAADAEVSSM